ncbi:MAG: hypothetical protein ACFFE4_09685 [Candidatus Thorarchaeota archaeon]
MEHDGFNLSKSQKKLAQRIIDCVMDGFQLELPPKHVIMRLKPEELIVNQEYQKFEKVENEIKRLEEAIELTDRCVKLIFEFDDVLKKLIFMNKIYKNTLLHMWCGILDLSIKHPIIFGCESKHLYHFGPLDTLKYDLFEEVEKLENEFPELFPYNIIESDLLIELILKTKHSDKTKDDLREMAVHVKQNEESPLSLINDLNQQKKLRKILKKIPHFDAVEASQTAIKIAFFNQRKFEELTYNYVSTICVPYKEVTYFLIDQFYYPQKKQCRPIYSLINALKGIK